MNLEDGKMEEIKAVNVSLTNVAEDLTSRIVKAIAAKDFGPASDSFYKEALNHGKEIDRRLKWWEEFIGPLVSAAHKTWKESIAKRDAIATPLETKKKLMAVTCGAYHDARERDRAEKEERIRLEMKREAEEELLHNALMAEKAGDAQTAENIIETPIVPVPVVLPSSPAVEKTSMRGYWRYRVIDENKIPREFLAVNTTKVGMHVRTHKEKFPIPGVEVYFQTEAAFSGK